MILTREQEEFIERSLLSTLSTIHNDIDMEKRGLTLCRYYEDCEIFWELSDISEENLPTHYCIEKHGKCWFCQLRKASDKIKEKYFGGED